MFMAFIPKENTVVLSQIKILAIAQSQSFSVISKDFPKAAWMLKCVECVLKVEVKMIQT